MPYYLSIYIYIYWRIYIYVIRVLLCIKQNACAMKSVHKFSNILLYIWFWIACLQILYKYKEELYPAYNYQRNSLKENTEIVSNTSKLTKGRTKSKSCEDKIYARKFGSLCKSERLYVTRKEGGSGLASVEESVDISIRRGEDYLKKSKERQITKQQKQVKRNGRKNISRSISSDKPAKSHSKNFNLATKGKT